MHELNRIGETGFEDNFPLKLNSVFESFLEWLCGIDRKTPENILNFKEIINGIYKSKRKAACRNHRRRDD